MRYKRSLIIAQTPPPFHGQAIMQKYLVDADWNWCKKDFVSMNFSDSIDEVGKFKLRKVWQLLSIICRILKKSRYKVDLAYYPPAGPNRIPIYRDVIIIFFLKLFSKKVLLHFHAGGTNQIFNKVSKFESIIIKKAFNKVDAVIVLTEWLRKEVEWCLPKKVFVVGNGIQDVYEAFSKKRNIDNEISFLFIGNLKKQKGVYTLLEAASILYESGERFKLKFIGAFHDLDEKEIFLRFIKDKGLDSSVQLMGSMSGDDKWQEFGSADVLCLPTFETEAMPISILEAMMFQMPVITTNWRSIPDIIRHQENGLLFEPQNAAQLASCMRRLIHSSEDRMKFGIQARKDYLQNFTVANHLKNMEKVFQNLLTI